MKYFNPGPKNEGKFMEKTEKMLKRLKGLKEVEEVYDQIVL